MTVDLYSRACWPVHAVDGDTLDVLEDDGRRQYAVRRERLMAAGDPPVGINTPELHDMDPAIRQKAVEARAFVNNWLCKHVACNATRISWPSLATAVAPLLNVFGEYAEVPYFVVRSRKPDSFDRWLSTLECQAGHDLGQALLDVGLAETWTR